MPLTDDEIAALDHPRYDQSTFMGRLRHIFETTSPLTLLSSNAQVRKAEGTIKSLVERSDGWDRVSFEEAWKAKLLIDSSIHPDTKKIMSRPLRFSCFVPLNLVILSGMLHPSQQTPVASMFWQWLNQTYNVIVNYANRNATVEVPLTRVGVSYVLACSISMGVSYYGNKLATRVPRLVQLFIPWIAVASAGVANVTMMRISDIVEGIKVRDAETKEELPGISKRAGRTAIGQVAVSRALVSLPLLTIPPVVVELLFGERARKGGPFNYFAMRQNLRNPVYISALLVILLGALPASLAVFPQTTTMSIHSLEPEYRNLRNSKGNLITTVFFNKGL